MGYSASSFGAGAFAGTLEGADEGKVGEGDQAKEKSGRAVPRAARARARLAVVLAAVLLFAAQFVVFGDAHLDDAFITYRYGQNLALGRGLVFNPGEHVLGTTSPGSALLAALVYSLVGRDLLPIVMNALSCAAWTAAAFAMFACLSTTVGRTAAFAGAAAVALGTFQAPHTLGLETNLVVALVLVSVWQTRHQRESGGALALGAAMLVRHDAILAWLPMALLVPRERWRRALGWALVALLPMALWMLFSTAYYGSPLPNTLAAKAGSDSLATYSDFVFRSLFATVVPRRWGVAGALFVWVAAGVAAFRLARRDRIAVVLVIHALLHLATYCVLRPGWRFHWHLVPVATTLGAVLFAGAVDLAECAPERLRRPMLPAVLALALGAAAWWPVDFARRYRALPWIGVRHGLYLEMAEFMRRRSAASDVILAEEVGTLAYYSDLAAIDHPGLVVRDPELELRRWLAGEPSSLRWLVANHADVAAKRRVFRFRTAVPFPSERPVYLLVDLHTVPRPRRR